MKQRSYFNQFIAINDNQTSNLPSIFVKSRQVKHTGGYLWELPHAGGVPNVRSHDTGREAVGDPEEKVVPVLPSAPGHTAVPLTLPAGLPHQRMHEDASQDAAQGSVKRGGQACRAGDGTRCRRPPP